MRQNGCVEKSQRVPFQFFRHCETFFEKVFFHQIFFTVQFFVVLQQLMLEMKRIPLLARQGPALAGTRRVSSVVRVFCEFDTRFEFITWSFFETFVSFCYF